MRPLKRFMVFASEAGALVLGFSIILVTMARGAYPNLADALAFHVSVLLALGIFLAVRRKTRPWKFAYDAEVYLLERGERKLHPVRFRCKKVLLRLVVWLPSAVAALVVFFFPVASHLFHPRSRYTTHYHVPIPWTATVLPLPGQIPLGPDLLEALVSGSARGRYGVTPFFERDPRFSVMRFWSYMPSPAATNFNNLERAPTPEDATHALSRQLRVGTVAITCWQYQPSYSNSFRNWLIGNVPIWEVTCEPSVATRGPNFAANFHGREDAIPAFYKIISGVTPLR